MNNRVIPFISFLIVMILFAGSFSSLRAQTKGNKNVIRQTRELPAFTRIDAGASFNVYLNFDPDQKVEIESDENLMGLILTEVRDGTLFLSSRGISKSTKKNAYITAPDLEKIIVHGAADLVSVELLQADDFIIDASGASDIKMNLEVNKLTTNASGASTVILSGKATEHILNGSGASTVKAYDLETDKTVVDLSGSSDANVFAIKELEGEISGSSDLVYKHEPEERNVFRNSSIVSGEGHDHYEDTVRVKIGGLEVVVIEEGDSVRVSVGNKELFVDEDGNVKLRSRYKRKFNGHWAGFDIGFNGYITNNFNMKFPPEDEYLDLRMEKSIIVNINIFEQNVALTKDKRFGALTGLGLSLPNYRFRRATHLSSDSSNLIGYISDGISVKKTKLAMMYLTIPVLFEWQTNNWHKKNSFHVGFGVIIAARLMSWTKIYYNEQYKDFELYRYNTESGQYEAELAATSPGNKKVKDKNDWFLKPVKAEATLRVGWGFINLWVTFSMNQMFRNDKGPQVYPWSAGITLLNF